MPVTTTETTSPARNRVVALVRRASGRGIATAFIVGGGARFLVGAGGWALVDSTQPVFPDA